MLISQVSVLTENAAMLKCSHFLFSIFFLKRKKKKKKKPFSGDVGLD
jgi:hypothetical protein